MASPERFYVVGGTVPLQAASYLERAADHELVEALLGGEYCLLLHARQMGKSSLSVRAMGRLQEQGVRAVLVDLAKLGGATLTPDQWYLGVLLEIGRGLGLREEFLAYWQAQSALSCVQRLFGALREVALARLPGPIVIFIDELDVTRSLRFGADEFFGAMRNCYDARVHDPESRCLTFCLVGSALPTDLVRDRRLSPFNVGRRIDLSDFTEAEVRPLAEGLDRPGAPALLRRACFWTAGHPYLTQSLCAAIAADPAVRTARDVDRVVARLFFEAEARERNVNLQDVANRMLGTVGEGQTPEEHRAGVLDLYRQVRRGRQVVDDEADRRVGVLKLSGVTRTVEGCLRLRNRIYARVFDGKWIAAQMPDAELRRQRAAYRRGALRTAAVALVMLGLVGGLAWEALRSANESRQRLARSYTDKGMRLIEEGDANGALPWLVEALRLDQGNRAREEPDRLRIAAALQRSVKPVQVWFHDGVSRAEVSPDSRRVVTAGADKTARVWDIATGEQVGPPLEHGGAVHTATFSPDGRWVVTASEDKTARVWEVGSGRPVTPPLKHRDPVFVAVFSPDGSRIATVTVGPGPAPGRGEARVWEARTGRPVTPSLPLAGWGGAVAFSPDGRWLATGSGDWSVVGGARVWDAETGRPVTPGLAHGVSSLAFSPDGHLLVTGGTAPDAGAQVWRVVTAEMVAPPLRHKESVTAVSFSPDGRSVLTGSFDGTARVWDARTGRPVTPPLRHGGLVYSAVFSPDGASVLTASDSGTARLWDAATGEPVAPPLRHQALVNDARFSPDGRWVVTVGFDGTARLWDLAARPPGRVLPLRGASGGNAWFSPDGKRILTVQHWRAAQVWEARTGRPVTAPFADEVVGEAAFSPDGRQVATLKDGPLVSIWEADGGKLIRQLTHPWKVASVTFSPDGRWIVGSSEDGTARVWEARTGRRATPPWAPTGEARHLTFSRDGRRVAAAGKDHRIAVWEVPAGRRVAILPSLEDTGPASLSPDGTRLLSTRKWDGPAQMWDASTGRRLGAPFGGNGAFSPDGSKIVSGLANRRQVWEVETRLPLTPPLVHGHWICSASFTPDGRYLATASEDGVVHVWDAATGEPVTPTLAHDASCVATFSPDGRRLLVAAGGSARIWELLPEQRPLSDLEELARLLSGYGVDPVKGAVPVGTKQFRRDWEALRTRFPADFVPSPEQVLAWQLDRLARYEQNQQWELAASLHDRLIAAYPRERDLFGRAPNAAAELGRWDRAAADYARAISLNPSGDLWLRERLAMAQLEGGDLAGYSRTCGRILDRFGTQKESLPWVLDVCTRGPLPPSEATRLVRLAPRDPRVLYRAGRYQEAMQNLPRAEAARYVVGGFWDVPPALFQAMCHAQVGQATEASAWLAKGLAPYRQESGSEWDISPGLRARRREAERVVKEAARR